MRALKVFWSIPYPFEDFFLNHDRRRSRLTFSYHTRIRCFGLTDSGFFKVEVNLLSRFLFA